MLQCFQIQLKGMNLGKHPTGSGDIRVFHTINLYDAMKSQQSAILFNIIVFLMPWREMTLINFQHWILKYSDHHLLLLDKWDEKRIESFQNNTIVYSWFGRTP